MGTQCRYTRPTCRHWAKVPGGGDAGELVDTQTVLYESCRRLYDVVVVDRMQCPPISHPPLCPRSIWHRVRPWNHPGRCPKCGTTMEQGPAMLLWD